VIEKKKGYVDSIRERWSDEDVLKVYHHARKLEAQKWKCKIKKLENKIDELYDDKTMEAYE